MDDNIPFFFNWKKNQVSKSAAQEQLRIQIQTMQNTILPNVKHLGAENATTEQRSEVDWSKLYTLISSRRYKPYAYIE